MTRNERRHVLPRRAVGRARLISTVVAVVALLGTLAGIQGHRSAAESGRPGHHTVSAPIHDTLTNGAVLTHPTGQRAQTPAWPVWIPAITGEQGAAAALSASFLLALVALVWRISASRRALPPRRGPPRIAFLR